MIALCIAAFAIVSAPRAPVFRPLPGRESLFWNGPEMEPKEATPLAVPAARGGRLNRAPWVKSRLIAVCLLSPA